MFEIEEKQAIVSLLGFGFDLVEGKCAALEALDAVKGTDFVGRAQELLEEIEENQESIKAQQLSGLAHATDIRVDGEISVSYGSAGQAGSLILANQTAKNELAQLLGLVRKPTLFGTTTISHQVSS